jgi:predicted site-specific integrase-resolvase
MNGQGWGKPSDAARYARVDRRTIYGWMREGLPFSRLPSGRVLISFEKLDRFLEGFEVTGNNEIVEKLLSTLEG